MIPSALVLLVLALAAFRTYRLLAFDLVLRPVRDRIVGAHYPAGNGPVFDREGLADWLVCAWCSGFWCAVGWWLAWLAWPSGILYVAVPFAVSAALAVLQHALAD